MYLRILTQNNQSIVSKKYISGQKEHITYKRNQIKLPTDIFVSKAFCQKKLE